MFRSMSGFRGQYHYLTMVVVSEFNEWRVLVYAPDVIVHGTRQFTEAKAKEHALTVARTYVHEYKHDDLPVLPEPEWIATGKADWLVYQA